MFKYLHQMCTLHTEGFAVAHQIKLIALIDGYVAVVRFNNALGPYLFARAILELTAFVFDVSKRLEQIAAKPAPVWRAKGEEFFAMIVRARFATSDPTKGKALEAAGCPSKLLKPLNVMASIETLVADEDGGTLRGQYDKLCDFVHHNLSSQATSSSGFRMGDAAYSSNGGALVMLKEGPVTRYEYPVPTKSALAVDETLATLLKCIEMCVRSLNRMPRSPFSREQLLERTGTALGITFLGVGQQSSRRH